jgi:hypothetical protein
MRRGLPQKFVVAGLLLGLCFGFAPSVSGSQPAAHGSGPRPQLGIAVVVDNQSEFTTPQALAQAKELFTYVKSLKANAVALNFPFYMTSLTSSDPTSGAGTPSPARIAALTMLARGMGLQVQLRPYLSEANFPPPDWRGMIAPKNLRAWFTNYLTFLRPYLVVAGSTGVTSFCIAAELTSMLNYLNYWIPLVNRAKSIFGGEIIFSENFPPPLETLPGTELGWDAYTPVVLSSDAQATVANLTKGDLANYQSPGFQATPEQTTLEEVGISAVSKAYLTPWMTPSNVGFPQGAPIMRFIQTNWFAAACNAFWTLHMKGIYFWVLYLAEFSPTENDSSLYPNWMDTPTATAIKSCFARGS